MYIAMILGVFLALWTPSIAEDSGDPQYPDGHFTYPTNFGDRYLLGTPINFTWVSNYTNINLFYAQFGNDANSTPIQENVPISSYYWSVSVQVNAFPNFTTPFHLHVVDSDSSDPTSGGIWSPGFYIDLPASATSSLSPTPTPTPTSTSLPASTTSAMAATTSPSSGLTPGAKAGIGVGVGLGVPLLVAMVALAFFFGRGRAAPAPVEKEPPPPPMEPNGDGPAEADSMMQGEAPSQDVFAKHAPPVYQPYRPPQELDAGG